MLGSGVALWLIELVFVWYDSAALKPESCFVTCLVFPLLLQYNLLAKKEEKKSIKQALQLEYGVFSLLLRIDCVIHRGKFVISDIWLYK